MDQILNGERKARMCKEREEGFSKINRQPACLDLFLRMPPSNWGCHSRVCLCLRAIGRLSRLLALSFFLCPVLTLAQRYVEISAEIETITYQSGDTNNEAGAVHRTISVVCIVGTNEWRIDNNYLQNGEVQWFFDGTNVCRSSRITKPLPTEINDSLVKKFGAGVPFDRAKSNVSIRVYPSPEGHPLGDEGVNIPWLAFCSGTYMKRPGRVVPLPFADLRHTRDRFAYSDKTQTFADEFGLPQRVDLFASKSRYEISANDFDKEYFFGGRYLEHTQRVLSDLQDGVHTFHYAATEWTNFLGQTFPTKFEFFQIGRKYEQNGNWFYRGIGTVKSIRDSTRPRSLFVPDVQQTIVDYRFRDDTKAVEAITYTSTNAFVAPTNDPALQKKFRSTVEQAPLPRPISRAHGKWFFLFFSLSTIVLIALVFLRQDKIKTTATL